jgi:hypothetical protein
MYDINDNIIHKIFYYDKKSKFNLFYLNNYKRIPEDLIKFLPFDTKNFITYEIIGHSIFAISYNNNIITFSKYNKIDNLLTQEIKNNYKIKYLLNKYKNNIFEFKLFNNDIYLVNIFNENEIKDYEYIKSLAYLYDINIPKYVNSNLCKFGNNMLDTFYNDYFLNTQIHLKNRNYYLTFIFENNKYLLYKL